MGRDQTTPNAGLRELEGICVALVERYEVLGSLARERHAALRLADPKGVNACIEREGVVVQQIGEIEQRRAQIVRGIAQDLGSADAEHTTIGWIADRVGGAEGDRLREQATRLRERMEAVQRENEIVRRALNHLSAHMQGLWKQASVLLNHAKTYGRMGAVEPGPRVLSALDLTS